MTIQASQAAADLIRATAVSASDCTELPRRGAVYMFTEGDHVMWVGRAKNLRQRIAHHTHYHHQGRHRTTSLLASTLANNMAEEATGLTPDASNPAYRLAVLQAAEQIRVGMKVRFVVLEDEETRKTCERYAITIYKPRFNRR